MRPSAMRPLWHPPGHRPGRAPRWPRALRRSPVPAATSPGQEPVLSASVQDSSASTMSEATCRFRPTPAAVSEHTATAMSGSLAKASTLACRAVGVWPPRIEEKRTPCLFREPGLCPAYDHVP